MAERKKGLLSHTEVDELLGKYFAKIKTGYGYEARSTVDFNEAQRFLKIANDAMVDFNRQPKENIEEKNICLVAGLYNAMIACKGLRWCIFALKKNNKDFELDFDDTSMYNLYIEVDSFTPHMELILKHLTSGNTYSSTKKASDYETDWRDVSIFEKGAQIYHLKNLIDYCDKMIENIMRESSSVKDKKSLEEINKFVSQGNGRFVALSMYYGSMQTKKALTDEERLNMASRIYNMFNDYFSAFMLINKPGITVEVYRFKDKLNFLLENVVEYHSIDMLVDFEQDLSGIIIIAESLGHTIPLKDNKLIASASTALSIASQMKVDLCNTSFDNKKSDLSHDPRK